MGKIRIFETEISNIRKGTTQVTKVYKGTTLVWELTLSFSPSYESEIGVAPWTSSDFTASNSGNIYITGASNAYCETTWTKNGVNQGYLWVNDGSGNIAYPNGRTFAISDGDIINFTYGGSPGQCSTTAKLDDSLGEVLLSSNIELT